MARDKGEKVIGWDWTNTYLEHPPSQSVLMAGYWGEIVLWTMSTVVPWVGIFGAGYVVSRYVYAFGSHDFSRLTQHNIDRFAVMGIVAIVIAIALMLIINQSVLRQKKRVPEGTLS